MVGFLMFSSIIMEFVDSSLGMMYGTVLSPFVDIIGHRCKSCRPLSRVFWFCIKCGLNPFGLYSPPLAASSSFRRKPESRRPDWIPHQVRNDRI